MTSPLFTLDDVTVAYNGQPAVRNATLQIPRAQVTALVGPSGSGKSSLLRSLNRLNDLAPGASLTGRITLDGVDIHDPMVDLVALRRRVGMVFQRPTAFPMSIRDNVAYGPRLAGATAGLDDVVRESLLRAGLWTEVQGNLDQPGAGLSVGQQQRLAIARCLAVGPEIMLMDEPTASLDPRATAIVEELIEGRASDLTIVLVTHSLGQAERLADRVVVLAVEEGAGGHRCGVVVEHGPTRQMFDEPADPRTADYLRPPGR
jgi:phosphate transport system ATP-binding protein